jgi:hypothetical protein
LVAGGTIEGYHGARRVPFKRKSSGRMQADESRPRREIDDGFGGYWNGKFSCESPVTLAGLRWMTAVAFLVDYSPSLPTAFSNFSGVTLPRPRGTTRQAHLNLSQT